MSTYALTEVLAAEALRLQLKALPRYADLRLPVASGSKIFSQADEDGILAEIFRRIGPTSRRFVEIGVENGLENNTLALLLAGWHGTWIEGDPAFAAAIAAKFASAIARDALRVLQRFVDLENVESLAMEVRGEALDLLCIDIDGNDFHVAPPFLDLAPRVIVVEYNARFGAEIDWVMPYDAAHRWNGSDYFGASLAAWRRLLGERGYGLVSCNLPGTNAFFVRSDCLGDRFDHVDDATVLFEPARYFLLPAFQIAHPVDTRPGTSYIQPNDAGASPGPAAPGGEVIAIDLDGMRFEIEIHAVHDRYISADIRRERLWEPFETRVFRALCEPGGCVVDVGANIGWYSLVAAAAVGPDGHVLALEPEPRNFDLLVRNLERNGVANVVARREAAGPDHGTMSLYLSDDNLGDHRLFDGAEGRRATSIAVAPLDASIDALPCRPTLIKCDTQGSEWAVVQGLHADRFDPVRCCWIIEFWPHGLAGMGAEPDDLLHWFESHGYGMFEVSEGNPRLVATDRPRLLQRVRTDLAPESTMFINLLMIHPSDARSPRLHEALSERSQG